MNLMTDLDQHEGTTQPERIALHGLAEKIAARSGQKRLLVAIAGPPGSGKTTVAAQLTDRLVEVHGLKTQIVPMDGFHYDNKVLEKLDLVQSKGAPETFDVSGLAALHRRLSRNDPADIVAVPVFDRDNDLSRGSARLIDPQTQILVLEGNYLLLDDGLWAALNPRFDMTVMIESDIQILRNRLLKRWLDLDYCMQDATRKVEGNDLRNAELVLKLSRAAEFMLVN